MKHKGTINIYTERLILRKHKIEDANAMFNNWAKEKEVTKFLRWQPYESVEDTKKIIREWISSYEKPDFYFWGKGIIAEAGRALIKFFFEEVGANRVYAKHAAENPNSGRAMQKMGMKYEGILRQSGKCNQGIVDEVYYSILRGDTVLCR